MVILYNNFRRLTKMFNDKSEKLNGRAAMIGFVAALGAYFTTGQVIPGIW
ncbi:high light-inducible protein [Cyanophage S-RIM4]|nr:high light-inducible protein [Cyanophage S-RIM4]